MTNPEKPPISPTNAWDMKSVGDLATLTQEQLRTALTSPEHLVRWMLATDRKFLILDAVTLVRGLPFPEGVQTFSHLTACYRDERRAQKTGFLEMVEVKNHIMAPQSLPSPLMKDELLEPEEIDEAILQLERLRNHKLAERAAKKVVTEKSLKRS